jgi:hypothetical protein
MSVLRNRCAGFTLRSWGDIALRRAGGDRQNQVREASKNRVWYAIGLTQVKRACERADVKVYAVGGVQ